MSGLGKYMNNDQVKHWTKVIAKFMSVQMIIKVIGMLVSIYLIRILAKEDYAYFTIAISIMSTIVLLSDSGIGSGFLAIGGRHWEDKDRMGKLVTGSMELRKKQFWAAALFGFPMLIWMLNKNEAPLEIILLMVVIVGVGSTLEIYNIIYAATLKLNNQYDSIQKVEFINTCVRLILVFLLSYIFLDAVTAVIVSVIAYGVNFLIYRNWASKYYTVAKKALQTDKSEILNIVKHQLPNAIYYAIIGQITIFLISVFGSTENVAEVGVLSRLAVMFSIIGVTLTTVVMPMFSKSKRPEQIVKLFSILMFFLIALSCTLIGFAMAFPDVFLYIFGNKYMHLTQEVVWLVAAAMLSLVTGMIFKINSHRGWVIKWYVFIPVGIATQVIALLTLNVSTVLGVVQYQLVLNIPVIFLFLHLFFTKVNEMKSELAVKNEISKTPNLSIDSN